MGVFANHRRLLTGTIVLSLIATIPPAAQAQISGGGVGGTTGTAGTAGTAGGQAGQAGQAGQTGQAGNASGILIDAKGVVRPIIGKNRDGALERKRREEQAGRSLPGDLNKFNPLRKVSLVALEAACEKFARDRTHVTSEMQFLAGLQRIDYVFVYPDEGDIVIAGPAEGYVVDARGRATGTTTGHPPLRLDDLMVALRALERVGPIRCSIDPRQENLVRLNEYLSEQTGPLTAAQAQARFARLPEILGYQDVSLSGVPSESHFAEVLVEADIRMKRLSVGVDPPPVKGFKSHLTLVGPGEQSMQRWWFIPFYDAFNKSEDGLAYHFSGQRVQLLSQEELVSDSGKRSNAQFTRVSIEKFSKQFTSRFPELAAAVPAFAELQNVFDLAVLAALLKKDRLADRIEWKKELFLDAERAPTGTRQVPRQTQSIGNQKMLHGKICVAQVGGGITIDPWQVLLDGEFKPADSDVQQKGRDSRRNPDASQDHPWWWD
jgi:hypothetical protein